MLYFTSPNFLIVSVPIRVDGSGNAQQYTNWGPQQQLIGCHVVAIETYANIDVASDQNNPGNSVITGAQMSNASITLYRNEGGQPGLWYQYVPMTRMRIMNNNDSGLTPLPSYVRDPFIIPPSILTYEKCQLNFTTNPPVAVAANTSALFGLSYYKEGQTMQEWVPVAPAKQHG